jgi:predicted XRE-type DNA-binding protein
MARQSAERDETITRGTGNVFADLGYSDADERWTKLRLAQAINAIVDKRRLTQAAAATLLGVNQPKVSALANYRVDGFSVERLMIFPDGAQSRRGDRHLQAAEIAKRGADFGEGSVAATTHRVTRLRHRDAHPRLAPFLQRAGVNMTDRLFHIGPKMIRAWLCPLAGIDPIGSHSRCEA